MKIAYLGGFTNTYLKPFLPDLRDEEILLSPGTGGFGLINIVVERLKRNEPTVLITLDNKLNDKIIKKQSSNFSFYSLPQRNRGALLDGFKEERKLINEALLESKPDIIHAHWTYQYSVAALSTDWNVPVLITARDHTFDVLRNNISYFPLFLTTLCVYRKAKYLTVVSPHVFRLAARLTNAKLWLVENCIPNNYFTDPVSWEGKVADGKKIISSVTSWDTLKNPKAAIGGFSRIVDRFPEAELHLCGYGMEIGGPAYQWACRHGIKQGIVFHGRLTNLEIVTLLKRSLVLLHTSHTEACNMAIAESMSLGVPVVGGINSGGIPWQLDYGRAGILVNIDKPSEIASALSSLMVDKEKWDNQSFISRRRAQELYDSELILSKYNNIYCEILNNSG